MCMSWVLYTQSSKFLQNVVFDSTLSFKTGDIVKYRPYFSQLSTIQTFVISSLQNGAQIVSCLILMDVFLQNVTCCHVLSKVEHQIVEKFQKVHISVYIMALRSRSPLSYPSTPFFLDACKNPTKAGFISGSASLRSSSRLAFASRLRRNEFR